jgi:outer membrane protein assembly factor BamE
MFWHSEVFRFVAAILVAFALAGCKQVPTLPGLTTYRIDVQQGNVITQDMVEKLRPGMTRQQVRFALGTPPVVDPFRQDRWDYVYYMSKGGNITEHRRLILLFDGDLLKRIEGDVIPKTAAPVAKKAVPTAPGEEKSAPKPASTPTAEQAKPAG